MLKRASTLMESKGTRRKCAKPASGGSFLTGKRVSMVLFTLTEVVCEAKYNQFGAIFYDGDYLYHGPL
jgi:hypothetical protein